MNFHAVFKLIQKTWKTS